MIKPLKDYTGVKAHVIFILANDAIVMQVLHMDDRFLCDKKTDILYQSQDMTVSSSYSPSISNREISLHGRKYFKSKSPTIGYPIGINIDLIVVRAINALIDWAANWDGWNGEQPINPRYFDAMGNEFSNLEDVQGCVVGVVV